MISKNISHTLINDWSQTITAIDAMIAVGKCLKDRATSSAVGHIDDVLLTLMEQRAELESMCEEEVNCRLEVLE